MRFPLILVFSFMIILVSWGLASSNGLDWMNEYTPDAYTIGLWHFNEGSGDIAYDASTHGNDGTIHGAQWTPDGKFGYGLDFDGYADEGGDSVKIYLHDVNFMAEPHTLEAWVCPCSLGARQTIMSLYAPCGQRRPDQIPMYIQPDGRVSFRVVHCGPVDSYEIFSTTHLQPYTWYHVAGVWDGDTMAIYVNGCKENWKNLPWDPTVPLWNMTDIGKVHTAAHTPNGARHFFNGYIDEVRISSIARTYECQDIPTLTEWGLIIFGVVLLGFITWVFLRRRKAVVSYQ